MKKMLILLSVLLVLACGIGFYMYNKPASRTVESDALYSLSAETLLSEFETDEAAANRKFLNKALVVNGRIREVVKSGNLVTIILETSSPMAGISCEFSIAPVKEYSAGEDISIKGLCTGMLIDVVLTKCEINE